MLNIDKRDGLEFNIRSHRSRYANRQSDWPINKVIVRDVNRLMTDAMEKEMIAEIDKHEEIWFMEFHGSIYHSIANIVVRVKSLMFLKFVGHWSQIETDLAAIMKVHPRIQIHVDDLDPRRSIIAFSKQPGLHRECSVTNVQLRYIRGIYLPSNMTYFYDHWVKGDEKSQIWRIIRTQQLLIALLGVFHFPRLGCRSHVRSIPIELYRMIADRLKSQ